MRRAMQFLLDAYCQFDNENIFTCYEFDALCSLPCPERAKDEESDARHPDSVLGSHVIIDETIFTHRSSTAQKHGGLAPK
jgi:hypothetical protein